MMVRTTVSGYGGEGSGGNRCWKRGKGEAAGRINLGRVCISPGLNQSLIVNNQIN